MLPFAFCFWRCSVYSVRIVIRTRCCACKKPLLIWPFPLLLRSFTGGSVRNVRFVLSMLFTVRSSVCVLCGVLGPRTHHILNIWRWVSFFQKRFLKICPLFWTFFVFFILFEFVSFFVFLSSWRVSVKKY